MFPQTMQLLLALPVLAGQSRGNSLKVSVLSDCVNRRITQTRFLIACSFAVIQVSFLSLSLKKDLLRRLSASICLSVSSNVSFNSVDISLFQLHKDSYLVVNVLSLW
jgi:hypothetical protein